MWSKVIVEVRSCDTALQHSPSWSNNSSIAWRCVGGVHCPWKLKRWSKCKQHQQCHQQSTQTCHTSSSILHSGDHTCRKHLLTFSRSDKEAGGWNQNSQSRTHSLVFLVQTIFFLLVLVSLHFLAVLQA